MAPMADGNHDDTNAINSTISTAIANNWPVRLTAGTYKVTSQIIIDYATQASRGFRLISDGAVIDGRTITSGPVLQIQCGGGTTSSPTGCFYFREEGTLFVNGNTPAYVVVLGKTDFSDAHNSAKFDHLIVNNANTAAAGGGCQLNYLLDSDVYAVCVAAGGAAGLALEQVQFSRISGAGTAEGTGGRGVVLENGYNFSNTFFALDLEVSPTCLSITFSHNGLNTFVSPYFNCVTAVNATASDGNVLVNPNYGGATVNYGPLSTGISVIGTGSRDNWLFPAAGSYVVKPIDDGLSVSNYNAPGASMSVTLPALSSVNAGWSMGFASDNGKGMTITTTSGSIISGGKSVGSITLGAGNYEYVRLQSDGNNFRLVSSTRNTRLANGFEPPPWPSNWLFPASSGYAAGLSDNGNVLSSYNSASGLVVTLPSTSGIPDGWSMGFATDNNKGLTVQVNSTTGGHIVWPGSGGSQTSLAMANTSQGAYEFMVLQYDGNGNIPSARSDTSDRAGDRHDRRRRNQPLELPCGQFLCRDSCRQWQCNIEPQQPGFLLGDHVAVDHSRADGMDDRNSYRRQQDRRGANQLHLRRAHSLPGQRRNNYFGVAGRSKLRTSRSAIRRREFPSYPGDTGNRYIDGD